jgi:hypothetical protein
MAVYVYVRVAIRIVYLALGVSRSRFTPVRISLRRMRIAQQSPRAVLELDRYETLAEAGVKPGGACMVLHLCCALLCYAVL